MNELDLLRAVAKAAQEWRDTRPNTFLNDANESDRIIAARKLKDALAAYERQVSPVDLLT